jgi:hypothetical protein
MNLTKTQAGLLQFIIEQVENEKIHEEEFGIQWEVNGASLHRDSPYFDSPEAIFIPLDIRQKTVEILAENKYLSCDWPSSNRCKCILRGEAYKAVNFNLTEPARPITSTSSQITPFNKIIKIFLASSAELKDDRQQFEIFIYRENKKCIYKNIFLWLEIWEDFIDAMSATRLQDEYNKAVTDSDIFISLFHTKVGRYTEEEFLKAFGAFQKNDKPFIYTYFKTQPIDPDLIDSSLSHFKQRLQELGHYPTRYRDINDLKHQFGEQLVKIIPKLSIDL